MWVWKYPMFRQSNCPSFTTRGSEGCHHLEMFPVLGDDEKLRLFFPTLTCAVFVFSSVSAFLRLPPPPPILLFTHPPHSLTHSLPRGRMYALASFPCPSGVPWSPLLLRGRRGTMCTAKGSDVRPGVPWVSASFAWQVWDNVHCQGVGCTPWHPLGLRLFCVAGVGHSMCIATGSDVRPGVPWVSASFAWQAWDNVHCQGVGCTPWRPLGLRLFGVAGVGQCACQVAGCTPWRPLGLRFFCVAGVGQCACQGVGCTPWSPLGLRLFCVAGVGQCALPIRPGAPWVSSSFSPPLLRGRGGTMCIAKGSDVRPGVPWVSASLAWQAWDNVHCQGVGCTPWRPLGLRLFCVAGVGQCALPRGRMYALASLGSPPLLRGRRGTMCIAKGSDVRPGVPWVSASFAWQAWGNVHCQGVGCTPWRPLGLRLFCVAGVGQCALPRGRMYALASLGSRPLLRGRRGTMCTAKGSDVRLGVPWVSASFVWQAWDNVHCQGVGCTLTHSLPHLTHLTPPHTYIQDIHTYTTTHTYTDTQTHIPLLQRFNYFGRSLGDWLWVTPTSALTSSCLSPLRRTGWGRVRVCVCMLHWLDSYSWTVSFYRLSCFDITKTDTCTLLQPFNYFGQSLGNWLWVAELLLTHSLTFSFTHLCMHIHTHKKLTHHHPLHHSYTSSSLLAFYAQSKSREVGTMWGYPVL